jgi:hypothetical protein
MPFMILYGGELVFAFLGARIAAWMWRSRAEVLALWRARRGPTPGEPRLEPDPEPEGSAEVIALRSTARAERESLAA